MRHIYIHLYYGGIVNMSIKTYTFKKEHKCYKCTQYHNYSIQICNNKPYEYIEFTLIVLI